MANYTLYFSDKCPDTKAFVEELERQNITYRAVNITESMSNLKEFLKLRDSRLEFENRKLWGFIGIPVLLTPNNNLIFELNDLAGLSCAVTPH